MRGYIAVFIGGIIVGWELRKESARAAHRISMRAREFMKGGD